MALELLYSRLGRELEPVNNALNDALKRLPAPCQGAASHIIGAGGKRIRPLLTVICAQMLGYKNQNIYEIGACMEMLHAATLLHDDVLDKAAKRRGKPAAHTIFGETQTILAGDALLALGNSIIASFGKPDLNQCYSVATMQTAAGEILEMNSLRKPGLAQEEYLEIAKGKTACLIAQACVMGALAANANEAQIAACQEYGENIGIAFQLVDDALDFAPESQTGKPCAGDLREGKLTLPLRLYRESLPEAEKQIFDEKFASASFSEKEILEIAAKIAPFATQSLVYANKCVEQARFALATLPSGQGREILMEMAEYICQRKN